MGLFQPASAVERYLKILAYGAPGVGKTVFALSFAEAGRVAVIDLEGGTALYGASHKFDVLRTKDFASVMRAIEELKRDGGKTYRTLVIDPITILWETLQDAGQRLVETRQKKGMNGEIADVVMTQRDWGIVKRHHARLITELLNLPMNVVITAHEKEITDENGNVKGAAIDGEKRMKRGPDIILHFIGGKQYTAVVEKMRGGLYPLGTQLHGPTYAQFAKAISHGASIPVPDEDSAAESTAKLLESEMIPVVVGDDDGGIFNAELARQNARIAARPTPQPQNTPRPPATPAQHIQAATPSEEKASIGKLRNALNRGGYTTIATQDEFLKEQGIDPALKEYAAAVYQKVVNVLKGMQAS